VGRRDLKDPEVLADYAQKFGVSREAFLARFSRPESVEDLREDVRFARQCGIEAVPSILLRTDNRIQRLTIGYQPFEVLEPHVSRWLEAA
ncbi:MAG: DsbA family protein, partial [Panacagrimonas sp.]